MTTSRLLIIVVIVIVVLTIVSMVIGAHRHQPRKPGQSRSEQANDMHTSGQGSSLASFAKLSSSLKQPFDLAKIDILGKHPTSRQLTLNAKGSVTLDVLSVSGDGVRQLSLVLTSPASQAKIDIGYKASGALPTGVDQADLPGQKDPKPALPNTKAGKDGDPTRCDLPIYPCGAEIILTSSSTQACTIEMR